MNENTYTLPTHVSHPCWVLLNIGAEPIPVNDALYDVCILQFKMILEYPNHFVHS